MKKIIFFLIIFCTYVQSIKAEVVYIDINSILNRSEVGKSLNDFLEKIKNKDLKKYKLIEAQLIKKEKELIAQQNILAKEEFQKKLTSLTAEVQKYRSDKKISLEELNKVKIEKTKEILKILNPIITEYVNLNSISLVIPKKILLLEKKI